MKQKLLSIITSIIFSCGLLVGCVSNNVGQEAYDILFMDADIEYIQAELMEYGIELDIEVKGDTVIIDFIIPNYILSYATVDDMTYMSEDLKLITEEGRMLLRSKGNEGHIRMRILNSDNDVILEVEDGRLLN